MVQEQTHSNDRETQQILETARQILEQYKKAFEELAK